MSDTKRRLIRAARILPEAVHVGRRGRFSLSSLDVSEAKNSSLDVAENLGSLMESSAELTETDKLRAELEKLEISYREMVSRLEQEEARNRDLQAEMQKKEAQRDVEITSLRGQIEKDREAAVLAGQKEGWAQGHAQGIEDGKTELEARIRANFEAQLSQTIDLLNTVYERMRSHLDELLAANPYRLIRLWERVLSRLLIREVAFDQESALRLLKELLSRASEKEDIRVYLNADDLDGVEAQKDSFGDLIRGIRNIEFLPDDEVDKGSCIVETGLGIYDARWRTQLEQISTEVETALLEGIAHGSDR
ncbi:MAG: hypothetical protein CSA35_06905 [Dethiosulfovibrio peptidovorans]|nr:MAG: hypothetical protein CSA35_06905 [Dethiosulfovibrio peptidovorans]